MNLQTRTKYKEEQIQGSNLNIASEGYSCTRKAGKKQGQEESG